VDLRVCTRNRVDGFGSVDDNIREHRSARTAAATSVSRVHHDKVLRFRDADVLVEDLIDRTAATWVVLMLMALASVEAFPFRSTPYT
jgi:hypothetical protein